MYKERQNVIANRREAHVNLGLIYQKLRQNERAEFAYKTAIRLVSEFTPARSNLADL